MQNVEVTVLMPAFNAEDYISEAISSVLNQTFKDFEFLIINDGSNDLTETIIKSFKDERIRYISQSNCGVSATLNHGLQLAKGKYIARMDADDICFPDRLEFQYTFMQKHPDYVLIGSDVKYIDMNGEFLYVYRNIGHSDEEIRNRIENYCPFIHSTVFYIKEIALELGGYDLKAHTFEDYHLWIKFINKGKVRNFKRELLTVRLNPQSVTIDENHRGKRFKELKNKILFADQTISEQEEDELKEILKLQGSMSYKLFSYHTLLAKKYLWNNFNPEKSRMHILKALHLNKTKLTGYILYLFSFFPKTVIDIIYKKWKSPNYKN